MFKKYDHSSIFDKLNEFFKNGLFTSEYTSFSTMRVFEEDGLEFPAADDKNFNKTEEVSETESHRIKKEIWTSIDGSRSYERVTQSAKGKQNSIETKEALKKQLDKAVEEQDFEKAILLRNKISKLK